MGVVVPKGVQALAMEFAARRFEPTQNQRWKADPVLWANERAKVQPWSKQREVMEAVRDNRRTAVHSCHDVGKTFIAATIAGWWIDVHPPGTAFVVTTAPTAPQVKVLLWREINRLHERAGLPGRTNLTEWYRDGQIVAMGRKPSDYNESAFQGIHDQFVLVILDEACGVPANLWDAAETICANQSSHILAIGNPDSNDGQFAKACRAGSGWKTIHIGYQHSPNFTAEVVDPQIKSQLISPQWVTERQISWGPESAIYQSKIDGIFPKAASDPWQLIPFDQAQKCRALDWLPGTPIEAGVDVGGGGDRTVVVERRGGKVGRIEQFQDPDSQSTVARIAECLRDWEVQTCKIDSIGIGWGVYGQLKEMSRFHGAVEGENLHGAQMRPVNFGNPAGNPKRFANRRAEVWWTVGRDLCRNGAWDLGALDDDQIAELCAPRYKILDARGRVLVEPKAEVKKRLKKSPDVADALLLAFWEGQTPGPVSTPEEVFRRSDIMRPGGGTESPFSGAGAARSSPFGRRG